MTFFESLPEEILGIKDESETERDFFMFLCEALHNLDRPAGEVLSGDAKDIIDDLRRLLSAHAPNYRQRSSPRLWLEARPPSRPFVEWPRTARSLASMGSPWSDIINGLSTPIVVACVAGGCKALIDLLKAWVEERKGRKLRIRKGNTEIEIIGGMGQKRLDDLLGLFETHFAAAREEAGQAPAEKHDAPKGSIERHK